MNKYCFDIYTCDHNGTYNIVLYTIYIECDSQEMAEEIIEAWIHSQPEKLVYLEKD